MLQLFEIPIKNTKPISLSSSKSALGQYMTPRNIASFMASMLPLPTKEFHLLDPGAGEGNLTCTFLDTLRNKYDPFHSGECSLFEYDEKMAVKLEKNIAHSIKDLPVNVNIQNKDFIESAVKLILHNQRPFTHAILNPPYKKIHSNSLHRAYLRSVGIETVNLYAAFVALAIALLKPFGTLVAIIPRSFCNGFYYKPFREFILRHTAIRRIHLFKSRTDPFKSDKVLQENVIIKLERDAEQSDIIVSDSTNGEMLDYSENSYSFKSIVKNGSEKFIYIPISENNIEPLAQANLPFNSLGIEVSTGPVVDFRLKRHLREMPQECDIPLLYPGHFNGKTEWPRQNLKKPNAIELCPETMKWLYPNGWYVVVRRLSSKEEKRRIVSYIVNPDDFPGKSFLGFENHLNVFHSNKGSLDQDLAVGLSLYLNSSFIDALFRSFNGHTQVNANDLRSLPYPSRENLVKIGKWAEKKTAPADIETYLKELLS